ncbi:hypothetical protein S245_062240 [Arachis hypogaea]
MWPLYLLFNKILKTEDERELKGDNLSAIDPYLFQHSPSNNNVESHLPSLCRSRFVDVPHVNQIYTWDCGLACASMVLKTIGVNDRDIQALAELCCTNSVWTVDLAYLLQKFFVAFSYFTVTFGANPNFSVESFYKEELPNNLVRLDMLFQKAVESGIGIQCRSISGREISILILSGKYIAIALVDQSKLRYRFLLICSVLFWLQYLIDDSFSTLTYSTFLPTFYIVPVVNQVYSFDTILFRRNLSLQLHYNTFFVYNFFLDHVIILAGKVQFNLLLKSFCFSHVLQDDVHVPEVSSNNPGYTGEH